MTSLIALRRSPCVNFLLGGILVIALSNNSNNNNQLLDYVFLCIKQCNLGCTSSIRFFGKSIFSAKRSILIAYVSILSGYITSAPLLLNFGSNICSYTKTQFIHYENFFRYCYSSFPYYHIVRIYFPFVYFRIFRILLCNTMYLRISSKFCVSLSFLMPILLTSLYSNCKERKTWHNIRN